jgi:aspartate/tyrosine/aromatic aminotransferase
MGSNGTSSVFTPAAIAAAPEDPLFGLMKAYREDPSDKKVDLGIGAYRDNNAKPWILPVVKKVSLNAYSIHAVISIAIFLLSTNGDESHWVTP